LHRRHIAECVKEHPNFSFRESSNELFDLLRALKVPLLVFSAGLADVILEILRARAGVDCEGRDGAWSHVVSNKMIFDDEGYLIGFEDPLIHIFNKNMRGSEYANRVTARRNIILLGDG
jgi:hypothetical protein